jgi:hypothetical protein
MLAPFKVSVMSDQFDGRHWCQLNVSWAVKTAATQTIPDGLGLYTPLQFYSVGFSSETLHPNLCRIANKD